MDVFLNASYIPAVLFTIILRERGKVFVKLQFRWVCILGSDCFLLF
ncbi:hypothetical protein LEP1GSC029_3996 [Leptospira interrogans str. 2002000626]|uniref:Uncharacterized protein n=1 Tax=Leptospira interrogans str. 2002000626 TaxID=996803 RepID=A0A829DC92_LEPIR|nr:hypothetical protein LEP1GSC029_3996 [Leptospira interrogans str. 2002000626]